MIGTRFFSKLKLKLAGGTLLGVLAVFASPAHAQVADATGTADPGRVQQQFLNQSQLPEVSPNVEVRESATAQAPDGAENVRFDLQTLQIDGVTIYKAEDLDPLYRNMLGTNVSLADIYSIANALTNKYRNDGYVLTQVVVPPQTIETGTVRLQVVEGFIDQVIVQGVDKETEASLIRKLAGHLQGTAAMNVKALERNLLLINDLPGVTARSILSPSETTPGAADLTIIVERKKAEAQVGFDNFGSRFLGEYEGQATGAINSIFGYNDRLSAQFVIAGDNKESFDELLFGSAAYEVPLGSEGTKLKLLASLTSTEPGYTLREFEVKGRSTLVAATVSHPFIRSRNLNLTGYSTFDIRHVDSKNNIEPTRRDRITSLRAGGQVQYVDTLLGVGVNSAGLELSHGLSLFNASDKGDSNMTRQFGDPRYFKAELNLQRLQRVTSQVNVLVAGTGQWSADPLLSSEEFGVGGVNFGRGYDPSEIVGDDGIAGKVELHWNQPHQIKGVDNYQLYAFFDIGRVWNQDATSSDDKRESLSSTGLGVRADITQNTQAGVAVAFPLIREIDSHGDKDPRYYVNVNHKF
ncbi:MAG: ShlB/FhaC/HecB family hemolysin secretion/activation protein [Alphaproteobacteria bacterium]|nr:ShlB/FhaC/HecB family hemolysin secretion/activation protein [Alphaproteobacteria bacterium]MCB1841011.1 ShlB/FhaC/HecB family hemolysin secretion/activation protein [Alphaproteobacteria bacterium]